ncbi:MAG: lipocalin family protein [Proteobacteria bacterium]|nr:lipocalin family protein [Pseudomonadota bacterium]MBU1639001.1 lipocalin family protein [Pseudomonadota bacterium]
MGCEKKYPVMETVHQVDIARYAGRWYEIARYPHSFEAGCSSVTADYSLQADGTIKVVNQCILADAGGKQKKAEGKAKIVDKASNAKLKVSFFWPFYGKYWIVKLDEDYQYAVVAEPSRKYVWILARTPHVARDLYDRLVADIASLGYDPARLIRTEHAAAKE